MVVYLDRGFNRAWYRAADFNTGLNVQIKLWSPDFQEIPTITLKEFRKEGMYYFDYDFCVVGTWTGFVYENGVKVTSATFHIEEGASPGIVTQQKKL